MVFANTRLAAQNHFQALLPCLGRYAAARNQVGPGHKDVSRLSPAIRHRLVLEEEIVDTVLSKHRFSTVEKFLQEIHWRTYWKGWLELRPQVWRNYLERIAWLRTNSEESVLQRVHSVCNGQSGVAIMDRFARELISTGYLHNHARMWWAGFWVHVEKLPWELGADFFFRHLLDADPASNTLSWRWVAGLQTKGKTYLPRRSNLEKYCAPEWLEDTTGMENLEDNALSESSPTETASLNIQALPELPAVTIARNGRTGFWLHEDDCAVEIGALNALRPAGIIAFRPQPNGQSSGMSELRRLHLLRVLEDGCDRAARQFQCEVDFQDSTTLATRLAGWAAGKKLDEVVAYAPFVGPLGDHMSSIREALEARGITLTWVRRPWDAELFPFAKSGFFPFWSKVERRLLKSSKPDPQSQLL